MASGLSAKLPVGRDTEDGYILTKTIEAVASQNLKHILLTNPGERMMDPAFGVGLKRYLFEMKNGIVEYDINDRISQQVSNYLPYINIQDIQYQSNLENESIVTILIVYSISPSARSIIVEFTVSL